MSQFTFSVAGSSRPIDSETVELPDVTAAFIEGIRYSARAMNEAAESLLADEDWTVEIADAVGLTLLTVLVSAIRSPVSIK